MHFVNWVFGFVAFSGEIWFLSWEFFVFFKENKQKKGDVYILFFWVLLLVNSSPSLIL